MTNAQNAEEAGWRRLQHDLETLRATRERTYPALVAAAKAIALRAKNADLAIITFDGIPAINRERVGAYVQMWLWVPYPEA